MHIDDIAAYAFRGLDPLSAALHDTCKIGWEAHMLRRERDPMLDRFRLRTHRCCVNDEILNRLERVLHDVTWIQAIEEHETTVFQLNEGRRLRVKKVNEGGYSSNIETSRQISMLVTEPWLPFDFESEHPEVKWLTLGYQPDILERELVRISLSVEFVDGRIVLQPIADPDLERLQIEYPAVAKALEEERRIS